MDKREYIACLAYKYHGDWYKIRDGLINKDSVYEYKIEENYITIIDDNYPSCLKELDNPPWILFYKGHIDLLNKPMISIIGARNMSEYGKDVCEECCEILSKKYVLVSGLAKGIDGLVHRCAMYHDGYTIGIIGSGLNFCYPYVNRDLYDKMYTSQLVISEYPCFVKVERYHFPWRNRLIACLGKSLIVCQANTKSGTMITVEEALKLGKDIYCFPYLYGNEGYGNNKLISEGAQIIYDRIQIEEI